MFGFVGKVLLVLGIIPFSHGMNYQACELNGETLNHMDSWTESEICQSCSCFDGTIICTAEICAPAEADEEVLAECMEDDTGTAHLQSGTGTGTGTRQVQNTFPGSQKVNRNLAIIFLFHRPDLQGIARV